MDMTINPLVINSTKGELIKVTRLNDNQVVAILEGEKVGHKIESSPVPHLRIWANSNDRKKTVLVFDYQSVSVQIESN